MRATPIDAVDIRHVTRWVQGLDSQGLSAKTIKNLHGLFSSTMKTAVRLGYCSNNPRVGCRPPEVDGDYRRDVRTHPCGVPTPAGRHDSALPIFIRSLVGTGFRWSEATALQVAAFDFNATTKTVRVAKAWKRGGDGKDYLGPPKTQRSRRIVSLPPTLADELKGFCQGRQPTDL